MSKVFKIPYLFPIGYVYISVVNQNPSKWFGGTWVEFAKGRTLVGVDTSQAEFNAVKKTGGEKAVKLKIEHMPKHSHNISRGTEGNSYYGLTGKEPTTTPPYNVSTSSTGGDKAHNNLPPYITVYMFVRTA